MIAPRVVPGFQPLSADFIAQSLMQSPEITFVKTISPPRLFGALSADGSDLPSLVLARMTADKAELLQAQAGSSVSVVRDPPLAYVLEPGPEIRPRNPGILVPHADGFTTTIAVFGPAGPLPDADVFIFGNVFPIQGVTDQTGRVTLKVLGESPDTIRALYVKPKLDHWSLWLDRPQLTPDSVNRVDVKPLSSHTRGFPGQQLLGWGQRAMGLDQVPPSFDGAGVKVVVVDSGAAQTTHRNLSGLGPGISVVGNDPKAWMFDTIGHGSHCAGIIGGGPAGTTGIRGFAPRAEIHVCRIFPGGRFSDLVSALDYCMENGVDIVNLSLGGPENPIVEQRIIRAKEMGIACIVAAGNSSGPVQFPASSPHVLAVGAMGKWGEFPEDSFHSQQALEGFQMRNGYFPASFSCFGPEVDVCGPGVAIISSLPQDSFGAWDGTSMAAPHVAGLAALVLAHHPEFQTALRARDARRVERLFQIIKETATPLEFGDAQRSGAGLPNAPRALGIRASAATSATASVAAGAPADDISTEILRRLLAMLGGTAAESQPQPQGMAMGAAAGASGGGRARGNEGVSRGPAAADPQMVQIRSAMKRAGLL
jgi:subtilisin family serine protease